jgi:purine-binding chemotaxis protein CheW
VTILKVTEILECAVLTKVPGTPVWIRGVLNLRGAVVPVVDLAVKFGLPAVPVGRRTCIVIMETTLVGERVVMGIVADAVSQVIQFSPQDIEPAPAFGTSVRLEHLEGMAKLGTKFVLILNMDHVFAADDPVVSLAGQSLSQPSEGLSLS